MNHLELADKYMFLPIKGRYVHNNDLNIFLKSLSSKFYLSIIGNSVLQKPIHYIKIGIGKTKVVVWSQMHGNESTTTKGLIDWLNYLDANEVYYENISSKFELHIIPILNPDGAETYTRTNANNIDLNRDAYNCTQPESKILRNLINEIQPNFALNLHDQRSIFGLKEFEKPATMSFLTAAFNESRAFNSVRNKAAAIIATISDELQKYIPNQVGRFDDSFNINCTGDYFTSIGIPTLLFEAGHYKDYLRDDVRNFVFIGLFSFFSSVSLSNNDLDENSKYLSICQNSKCFFDIIFKNVKIIENNLEKIINFAVQFEEVLSSNSVIFLGKIVKIDELENYFAHEIIDGNFDLFESENNFHPILDQIANFKIGNKEFINAK